MKKALHKILLISCLSWCAVAAYAQDAAVSDYEITESDRDRFERDKIIFAPGGENESRFMPARTTPGGSATTPSPKDSTATNHPKQNALHTGSSSKIKHDAPVKATVKPQPPKEDDDAILSFNFLYYIIQKYKLQEIID